jgi:hypothetical protein
VRHLPSIEALSDVDDRRLAAELELRAMLEELARVREFVENASAFLATVVVSGADPAETARSFAAFPQPKRKH